MDFEIIGSITSPFDEEAKKHRVICHGRKSLNETKDELRKAHILVNIGNRMTNQVPSKIFEYISTKKSFSTNVKKIKSQRKKSEFPSLKKVNKIGKEKKPMPV